MAICRLNPESKGYSYIFFESEKPFEDFKYIGKGPDGGFRGWGSVIPVKVGSRIRYFWLTFDRHNGSGYNWSYGNI